MSNTNSDNQERLNQILIDFQQEITYLISQSVLTRVDQEKLLGQAKISRDAMFRAKDDNTFNDRAKDKLLDSLLLDFETSLQRILDKAVSKAGEQGLLLHRLYRSDNRIRAKLNKTNIPVSRLDDLQVGMDLLKLYALRSLPTKKNLFSQNIVDVENLVRTYETTILEYLQQAPSRKKFLR